MKLLELVLFFTAGFAIGILLEILIKRIIKYKTKSNDTQDKRIIKKIVLYTVTALGYVSFFAVYGLNISLFYMLLIFSISLVISVVDIKIKLIPNELIILLLMTTIIFLILYGNGYIYINHVIGLAVAFIIFLIPFFFKNEAGAGDVKLAALCGLILGFPQILYAIVFMSIYLLIYFLIQKLGANANLKTKIAFGPFISAGLLSILILRL